jgi:hypothetical protein
VSNEEELPPLPRVGATPRAVRDALRHDQRGAFERTFRASLDEAARELDLDAVHATIEHWRRRAGFDPSRTRVPSG